MEMTTGRDRLQPIGFLSYARQDDERSGRQLFELRRLLSDELQVLYGRQEIKIFQDVAAIPPGARWQQMITEAIANSTFFIPILTPSFAESEFCCFEIRMFLEREAELNRLHPELAGQSRIFPIRYIPFEHANAYDPEVIDLLAERQTFDFAELRIIDPLSQPARNARKELAESINRLLQIRVQAVPDEGDEAGAGERTSVSGTQAIQRRSGVAGPGTTDARSGSDDAGQTGLAEQLRSWTASTWAKLALIGLGCAAAAAALWPLIGPQPRLETVVAALPAPARFPAAERVPVWIVGKWRMANAPRDCSRRTAIALVPGRAVMSLTGANGKSAMVPYEFSPTTPGVVTTRDYSYERIGGGEAISLVPRDEKSGNAAGTMVKCAP